MSGGAQQPRERSGGQSLPDRGSEGEPRPEPAGEDLADEPTRVYRAMREGLGDRGLRNTFRLRASRPHRQKRALAADGSDEPYGRGRAPRRIDAVLGQLRRELEWNAPLAEAELLTAWPEVVGQDIARYAQPAAIEDGVIVVACSSTAWATQLRALREQFLTSIMQRFPDARITGIRVMGPGTRSWKHGPRSVQGRGPRDTYG